MKEYRPDDFDFNKALGEIKQGIAKPNILICGATGAGKSSVVNYVFGEDLAKTGDGIPVTRGITKYQRDDSGVVLYDTEGYEIGTEKVSHYKTQVENWINQAKSMDLKNQIHEVWYCISGGNKRVTDMDIDVIKSLVSKKVPLAVVLTQIDNLDEEELTAMEEAIVHYCDVPFFRTCVSQDLEVLSALKDYLQWEALIAWAIDQLDESLREGFIGALQGNLTTKRGLINHKIIPLYTSAAAGIALTPIPFSDAALLVPVQIKMALHIMKTYGLDQTLGNLSSLVGSVVVSESGRLLAQTLSANLLKLIPGVGTAIGTGVNTAVASSFTAAMGYAISEICFRCAKAVFEDGKEIVFSEYFNSENIASLMGEWFRVSKNG
ncbi:YcjF family protein [Acetobacterium bakii]|uniref:YcjF family protein n=1 Tax=Acetobacterium bakii TaxID=52689 RepID=UPI0006810F2D|nr:GTPase [Acetobacterium bakii]